MILGRQSRWLRVALADGVILGLRLLKTITRTIATPVIGQVLTFFKADRIVETADTARNRALEPLARKANQTNFA